MKKTLSTLFILACLVIGSGFLYEYVLFQRLSAQLETQTEGITLGYNALVTADLLPLSRRFELTPQQQRLVDRIDDTNAELGKELSLRDRVEMISSLQIALSNFVSTMKEQQPAMASDAAFVHIQEEMSERGNMRAFLEQYNTTALKWNRGMQSALGSLTASMREEDAGLLPYLRFDGNQEYVPIVTL